MLLLQVELFFYPFNKIRRAKNRCEILLTVKFNDFHGVTFINDKYPRATNESGRPQTEEDWVVEPILVKKGAAIGSG